MRQRWRFCQKLLGSTPVSVAFKAHGQMVAFEPN